MLDNQLADKELIDKVQKALRKKHKRYSYKEVKGVELIHNQGNILVPTAAQQRVLDWYHQSLVHPGYQRMYETMKSNFTWKGMQKDCENYCKRCRKCQLSKKTNKRKYGLIPEKKGEITKWSRINVDLYGPKKVRNVNGYTYDLHVMTMVDPVTGWFKCCQLYKSPTAYRCQQILDTVWLARYPRPKEIGSDNGSEFKGVFEELCANMEMKAKLGSLCNPQSNSVRY